MDRISLIKNIYVGDNSLREAEALIFNKKSLIVTDQPTLDENKVNYLLELFANNKVEYEVMVVNTMETVEELQTLAQTVDQDVKQVISFGANGVCFAAKIIKLYIENPEFDFTSLTSNFQAAHDQPSVIDNNTINLVAIPTRYMLGGEYGPFVLATYNNKFHALLDRNLLVDSLILDPQVLIKTDSLIIAEYGFDCLTHCIEVAVNKNTPSQLKTLCSEGAVVLYNALVDFSMDPESLETRGQLITNYTYPALAFMNGFSGMVHSLTTYVTSKWGIAHGASNAIFINDAIKYNSRNSQSAKEIYLSIAQNLVKQPVSDEDETLNELLDLLNRLKKDLGIKRRISDYGVSMEQFTDQVEQIANAAFNYQSSEYNPVKPELADFKLILQNNY